MNDVIIFHLDNKSNSYKDCYNFLCLCLDSRKHFKDTEKKLKALNIKCIKIKETEYKKRYWDQYCNGELKLQNEKFKELVYFDRVEFFIDVSNDLFNIKYFVLIWQVLQEKYSRINFCATIYSSEEERDYYTISHLLINLLERYDEKSFRKNVVWGMKNGRVKALSVKQNRTIKYAPFELISYSLIKDIWTISILNFLDRYKKVFINGVEWEVKIEELFIAACPKKILKKEKIIKYISDKNLDQDKIDIIAKNTSKEFTYFRSIVNFFSKKADDFLYMIDLFQNKMIQQSPLMSVYLLGLIFYNDNSIKSLKKYDEEDNNFQSLSLLKKDLLYTRDITDGIIQLLENVIVHAYQNVGLFVMQFIRIKNDQEEKNFHFWIGDYSEKGMVNNFRNNIKKLKNKNSFDEIQLNQIYRDLKNKKISFFFNPDEKEKLIWEKYNQLPGTIAHHYGLQLFQLLIMSNKGTFQVRSQNQIYCSDCNQNEDIEEIEQVVPGTQYSIDIPINHNISMVTTGIESKVNYTNVKDLNYTFIKGIDFDSDKVRSIYDEVKRDLNLIGASIAELKVAFINQVKDELDKIITKDESNKIILFDAKNIALNRVELLCKSIVLFMSLTKCKKYHFAFINCSEYFIVEMVRMFSVFYGKNGKFQYIDDVQIYFCGGRENASLEFLLAGTSLGELVANAQKYAFFSGFRPSALNHLEWMLEKRLDLNESCEQSKEEQLLIPFDLICNDVVIDKFFNYRNCTSIRYDDIPVRSKTLFEYKVEEILSKDIQNNEWGCHLDNVHVRLGKEIHIDGFYEAELLFHNTLYTYRFARLLVKSITDVINKNEYENYVLVGYETYSEMLLYEIYNMMDEKYKKGDRLSYIVYEQRQIVQTYKNRINKKIIVEDFRYIINQRNFYNNACFLIIVPISSTLMTFDNIRKLLISKLDIEPDFKSVNYTLILVSDENSNSDIEKEYWVKSDDSSRTVKTRFSHETEISYFTNVKATWWDACKCNICFPIDNQNVNGNMIYLKERPLIDTNRASTVPMAKFERKEGTLNDKDINLYDIENEKRIELLKDSLVYGHVERNGNHFMYYIKTEDLFHKNRDIIKNWLSNISITKNYYNEFVYDFIISPMHYSNTGFIEEVNNHVFKSSSYVIYLEINKEFRSNIKAKFSNITMLYYNLKREKRKARLRFHYVDDMIITGRTFYRMKSLIHSLFPKEAYDSSSCVRVELFRSIVILLNRNSPQTIYNYLNEECNFYSFINLNVSVMRSFEDACVLCKYIEDCKKLSDVSSTTDMYSYWNYQMIKHQLRPMYLGYKDKKNKDHAFLRLWCIHRANIEFNKMGLSINDEDSVILEIIQIIKKSKNIDELISYFKVLSRPFITYHKTIKNVALKLNLHCMNYLLFGHDALPENVAQLYQNFFETIDPIIKNKENILVLNILASLTNLESNYILRKDVIKTLYNKFKDNHAAIIKFKAFIKRIVCKNDDEAKSLWLEHLLIKGTENIQCDDIDDEFVKKYGINSKFGQSLYLENTAIIRNAMDKNENELTNYREEKGLKKYKEVLSLNNITDISDLKNMIDLRNLLISYEEPNSEQKIEEFYYCLAKFAGKIMKAQNTYLFIRSRDQKIEDNIDFNIISCYFENESNSNDYIVGIKEISKFADIYDDVLSFYNNIKESSYYIQERYVLVKLDNNMTEADLSKLTTLNKENIRREEKEIYDLYAYTPVFILFQYKKGDGDVNGQLKSANINYLYCLRNFLTLRTEVVHIIEKDFNNDNIQLLCEKQEKMSMLLNIKSVNHTEIGGYQDCYIEIKNNPENYDIKIIELYFNSLIAVVYNFYLECGDGAIAKTNEKYKNKYNTLESYLKRTKKVIKYYMSYQKIEFVYENNGCSLQKEDDLLLPKEIGDEKIRCIESEYETYNIMYFTAFFIDMLKSVYDNAYRNGKDKFKIYVSKENNKLRFKNDIKLKDEFLEEKNNELQKALRGKGKGGISLFVAKKFFEQDDKESTFNAYYYKDSKDEKIYYVVEWPVMQGGKV